MPARLLDLLLLAGLGLLFFFPLVLQPDGVLWSDNSDMLEEVLPSKQFLVRWRQATGELPLWCPSSYAGMPFLHDVKVAAFYPPHLPLYLVPEHKLHAALSWLVVLHVMLAGAGMYLYAEAWGLGRPGRIVAAAGFMFAGKWLLHLLAAGHYFMVAYAWLPFVMLGLDGAIRRRSFAAATGAGVAFGLIVLGSHPQVTFFAGLFVALWSLGTALEQSARRAALGGWLLAGAWTLAVAVALSAVELLPALEATGQSSRAVGVPSGTGGAHTLWVAVNTLGPPRGGWEGRGAMGLVWLAAALLAPVVVGRRARYPLALFVGLVLFALGGSVVFQNLPGFSLFQLPSRMFLMAAVPVALLAGATVDRLLSSEPPGDAVRLRARSILLTVSVAGLALLAASIVLDYVGDKSRPAPAAYLAAQPATLWLSLGVALLGLLVLAAWLRRPPTGPFRAALPALLVAEVVLLTWPLVQVRPEPPYGPYGLSSTVQYLLDRTRDLRLGPDTSAAVRILDRGLKDHPDRTVLPPGLAMALGLEPVRGYNSLDVRRYKEYLQIVAGEADRPLKAREGTFGFPIFENFPIQARNLVDLLGVRFLVQPSDFPPPGPGWELVHREEAPEAYLVIAGGRQRLPAYSVWENSQVLPLAFVVANARPLPPGREGVKAMEAADFRREVFLEGAPAATPAPPAAGTFRKAEVRLRQPNRVEIHVPDGPAGTLVLTDLAYPGWQATVDGRPAPLYRADMLFRGVPVEQGEHEVVFTFAPKSYRRGKLISAATAVLAGLALLGGLVLRRRGGTKESALPTAAVHQAPGRTLI